VSENKNQFINQLAYFGGSISGDPAGIASSYQDLEEFVASATLHMSDDLRVTHCFLTWLSFYGYLLSPSKLRRILKDVQFEPVVLGAFVSILMEESPRKSQWKILSSFLKRTSNRLLFRDLPTPKQTFNAHFKKVGIIAHPLNPDTQKFLIKTEFVLNHCPEIKYRAMGLDPVPSDLRAYLEKEKPGSLYEIAKATHHFRAQVNIHYKMFSHFGIFDGSLLTQKSAA
jgi:hypothetical protein